MQLGVTGVTMICQADGEQTLTPYAAFRRYAIMPLLLLLPIAAGGVDTLINARPATAQAKDARKTAFGDEARRPDYRTGSLTREEPQAVYAADPVDPWNRLFYCLYTRTIQLRLSDDFPEGRPFDRIKVRELPVSKGLFQRVESGDRAIEPLYPSQFARYGKAPFERWVKPRYTHLKQALEDALKEKGDRSPLARALMQADVWAAYDRLGYYEPQRSADGARRQIILSLLGRLVKKLALTAQEIKALPDNYAAAARVQRLPDLFSAADDWLEMVWSPERVHEHSADDRRVARVFLKPASPPADKRAFLNGLRQRDNLAEKLDRVALVIQSLAIDQTGKIVPTPLTYEVQIRRFLKGQNGKLAGVEVQQYELSRRLILAEPSTGGLEPTGAMAPAYLASGGNDLDFASDSNTEVEQPVLVRLKTRCTACHGPNTAAVFTFEYQSAPSVPLREVKLLKPVADEHAHDVVGRKHGRRDFKALQAHWN
jgi:hypothetical protein